MTDSLRHHRAHRGAHLFGGSFMERLAEKVSEGMGTVKFLVISTLIIASWVLVNHLAAFLAASWHGLLAGKGFDPAPFILLNLVFSAVAFYTGALVIIAQKAQAKRDRVSEEADAKHREDLHAQLAALVRENTGLTDAVHELVQRLVERGGAVGAGEHG